MKNFYRGVVSFAAVTTLLVAACAGRSANEVSQPTTLTSAECLVNGVVCVSSTDCCSLWCVNGYCEQKSP